MLAFLRSLLARIAGTSAGETQPLLLQGPPSSRAAAGSSPTYDQTRALSAAAAFPATFKAVTARGRALAARKIKLSLDPHGERPVEDHPVLNLIGHGAYPNRSQGWIEFVRQMQADFDSARNVYLIPVFAGGAPARLYRRHPQDVEPIPGGDGLPAGYRVRSTGQEIDADTVIHIRGFSWEDDDRGLYGSSPMIALDAVLHSEKHTRDFEARSAEVGRPSVIISPASGTEAQVWSVEQSERIAEEYTEKVRAGGALVNRMAADIEVLQHSPKDQQSIQIREANRTDIGAVLDVPPVMMGTPGANYAEADSQRLGFWEASRDDAALIAEGLTKLAQMFPGPRVYVRFDYSDVPALQRARDAQLERVAKLVDLGASPLEAARFEGLGDAPLPLVKPSPVAAFADAPPPAPASEETPKETEEDRPEPEPRQLDRAFFGQATREQLSAEERAARWNEWIRALQGPLEQKIAARMDLVFAQQQASALAKLEASQRAIDPQLALFNEDEELARVSRAIVDLIEEGLDAGFENEAAELDAAVTYDTRPEHAARRADAVSRQINATTARQIKALVEQAAAAGDTAQDLAAAIEQAAAFSPERSLTVARTEAAHAVNTGQTQAQKQATAAGVAFRVMWLSSQDNEVRDSHRELDGKTIDAGGEFTTKDGRKAPGPSQFNVAEEDINCRCTTISRRIQT